MNEIIKNKIADLNLEERAYIYFEEIISEHIFDLKRCFPDWTILYSIKANPNRDIIRCCYNNGLGFDAASTRELDLLLKYQGHNLIQYSCPGKSDSDLKKAMKSRCILVADSIGELSKIYELQKLFNSNCKFGIRLNIGDKNIQLTESMVGEDSHFGITLNELESFFRKSRKVIPISHIHIYSGSQILDELTLASNFSGIAKTVQYLMDGVKLPIKSVSFGGGFGIPYRLNEKGIDFNKLKNLVNQDPFINQLKRKNIELCIESGRYLVADSGYFLSIVRDVKFRNNMQIVITDGLMNAFFRPIFLNAYHHVYSLHDGEAMQSQIVGNTCTPLDTFPFLVELPKVKVGDKLVFEKVGAYGLSMTPMDFISSKEVMEIYVR